ncbi:MAG: fatty acyl-AMP ligase [Acidobacteriota bacterium]
MSLSTLAAETLNDFLARAADFPAAGLRFVDRREAETFAAWSELLDRALIVAGGLRAAGVRRGERVALVFPTQPAFFAAFFGVLACGAVPVPLYPPVRLGRLAEYHRRTAAMIRAANARMVLAAPRVRRILGETIEQAQPPLGCHLLSDLPAEPMELLPVEPDDLALVQFSSGTTVDPKPVALTHRALVAQTRALNEFWPDSALIEHSGVSWLPLYHDMGLIGCILPALERPALLTLLPPEAFVARPALWLRAISRYRATVSPAPNFAYGLCLAKIRDEEMEGVDLSCWRVALNGAEAVAPEVLRAFRDRFARWGFRPEALTPVYGLSEAALAVTFSDLGKPFRSETFDRRTLSRQRRAEVAEDGLELPSLGRPLPGFEVEIRAEHGGDGTALPEGHIGRVWARGPSLMEGYLNRPRATAEALVDGWLDTGDLGFLRHGELYLTGRAKDLVVLRGRNHAPEEIEHPVYGVAGVRSGCAAAVSWLPEGEGQEELVLFVETARDATDEEIEGLPEACRRAVLAAAGVAPDRVVPLEPGTLPRTTSGKLRRQEALRLYLGEELTPPNRVTPIGMLGALARSGFAYVRARRAQSSASPNPPSEPEP